MPSKPLNRRYLEILADPWDRNGSGVRLRKLLAQAQMPIDRCWQTVANAHLISLTGHGEQTLDILKTLPPTDASYLGGRLLAARVLRATLGRPNEALASIEKAEKTILAGSAERALADVLLRWERGCALLLLRRSDEAEHVLNELQVRYGDATDPTVRAVAITALIDQGQALGNLGRSGEAMGQFDAALERIGTPSTLQLRVQAANAIRCKGEELGRLGRPELAIAQYDQLVSRFGRTQELPVLDQVAWAVLYKGVELAKMGRTEEAAAQFESVLSTLGRRSQVPFAWPQVAWAMYHNAVALSTADRSAEAISRYDLIVNRYSDAKELQLRLPVAWAIFRRGAELGNAGRNDDEAAQYDLLLERYGRSPEHELREPVAWAMYCKGVVLSGAERHQEAIRQYGELLDRFGTAPDPELREPVSWALRMKGVSLSCLRKFPEAIRVLDELLSRFADAREIRIRDGIAKALFGKGFALGSLGRINDELAAYDQIVRLFKDANSDLLKEAAARAQAFRQVTERRAAGDKATPSHPPTDADIPSTNSSLPANLKDYLDAVLNHINPGERDTYFDRMKKAAERTNRFLLEGTRFVADGSFLLVLREWNSYTPVIPAEGESDRGGGYFIRHGGQGIVIDPGYDFINNFHNAGGRLCDIDHIFLTHAHDDHTAEFESLLMLLHQRNHQRDKDRPDSFKRIGLYLSVGAERKFSGLFDLRDPRFNRIVTLCSSRSCQQVLQLNETTKVTTLPAYHDDVVTKDLAVGLGFTFSFAGPERLTRLLFTSDSGLYPRCEDAAGEATFYSPGKPRLDTSDGKALHRQYPGEFDRPELMVVHIGSIRENEFRAPFDGAIRDPGERYYVNHLGALGTITMIDQLRPEVAIVSEFGAELRGFHIELVKHLQEALVECQDAQGASGAGSTFVIPGGPTIAYDIANRTLLCHETVNFRPPAELECRGGRRYDKKWDEQAKRYSADAHVSASSVQADKIGYLFLKKNRPPIESRDALSTKKYFEKFYNHQLPFHRRRRAQASVIGP